ncbi:MAG: Ig-like domain-containing protein [Mobilitalea sp.]
MKKNFLCNCIITLGLLLFLTLIVPYMPLQSTAVAQASETTKDKKNDYRLYVNSKILVKGKSFVLKVNNLAENSKVTFKSNDSEIASVNDDGTITAVKVGVAIITVTIKDDTDPTNLYCEVTVGPPAFSVKLTRSRIILGLNNIDFLRVILKPTNTAEDAKFSSNDPSIASVSPGGRITANKIGLTYLFAEIESSNSDGTPKYAMCSVIVTSTSDASLLDAYFNDHQELNYIPESDLAKALDEFFNGGSAASSNSLVSDLNKFLDSEFDLSDLRSTMKAANSDNSSVNRTEIVSTNK